VRADIGAAPVEFTGEDDHLHLLDEYPPTVQLPKLVNSPNGVSARRLRQRFRRRTHRDHPWSPSYLAASYCGAPLPSSGSTSSSNGGQAERLGRLYHLQRERLSRP